MVDIEHEIQNVVLTITYKYTEFDLERLAVSLEGARYDPEVFAGMTYRMNKPKATFLTFASGKVNCVGAKSVEDGKKSIERFTEKLRDSGVKIESEPKVAVQNIVASFDFERKFDLERIAMDFQNTTEYEPEVFPGLVFRMEDPKAVILLFVQGKGVGAGFEREEDVERVGRRILEIIE